MIGILARLFSFSRLVTVLEEKLTHHIRRITWHEIVISREKDKKAVHEAEAHRTQRLLQALKVLDQPDA